MVNKPKILVVKLASLGDILQTTPLIRLLASKYDVYYLTFSQHAPLLKDNPHILGLFTFLDKSNLTAMLHNVVALIKIFFLQPQISINLHKIYALNYIFKLMGISKRLGIIREKDKRHHLTHPQVFNLEQHHIKQYLSFASILELNTSDYSMEYFPGNYQSLSNPSITANIPSPYVVICAGGGKNKWANMLNKRWPEASYISLGKSLISKGYNLVLVGNHDDTQIHHNIANSIGSNVFDVTNKTSLNELFLIIKSALFYIGNDSFLLHFASTTKTQTLGLFGPTSAKLLAPLGASDGYIQSQTSCSPCYEANLGLDAQAYKCQKNLCMQNLEIETVTMKISPLSTQSRNVTFCAK